MFSHFSIFLFSVFVISFFFFFFLFPFSFLQILFGSRRTMDGIISDQRLGDKGQTTSTAACAEKCGKEKGARCLVNDADHKVYVIGRTGPGCGHAGPPRHREGKRGGENRAGQLEMANESTSRQTILMRSGQDFASCPCFLVSNQEGGVTLRYARARRRRYTIGATCRDSLNRRGREPLRP